MRNRKIIDNHTYRPGFSPKINPMFFRFKWEFKALLLCIFYGESLKNHLFYKNVIASPSLYPEFIRRGGGGTKKRIKNLVTFIFVTFLRVRKTFCGVGGGFSQTPNSTPLETAL